MTLSKPGARNISSNAFHSRAFSLHRNLLQMIIDLSVPVGSKPDKVDLTFCAISQLLCIKLVSCIGLLNYDMLKSYGSDIHLY